MNNKNQRENSGICEKKHKNIHKFNDVLEIVLLERRNRYSSTSTIVWEQKISRKISNYFENKYIENTDEIVLNHFFGFVRYKVNGELISDKYMKAITSLVKSTMRKAMLKGYIDINPFDYDFVIPKGNLPEPTERLVSDADLKSLFSILPKNKRFKIVVPILLMTGMRIGELNGLFWDDIDFEKKIISVKRGVVKNYITTPAGELISDGMKISKTKTVNSIREIPVNEIVLNLLREWLQYRDERKGWKDLIYANENQNLVFPNYAGNITNPTHLYKNLIEFLEQNHLQNCKVLFHKLRHCYATHMLDCGIDIAVISKLLGHKSITTTANIYTKVNLKPKQEAVNRHSKYLNSLDLLA